VLLASIGLQILSRLYILQLQALYNLKIGEQIHQYNVSCHILYIEANFVVLLSHQGMLHGWTT
jgi:hypothetical protein